MTQENCYVCENPVPEGQSFYEDHGVKVCLNCFRTTPRCKKCKFPSNALEIYPGLGAVCEFCRDAMEDTGMSCYLCSKNIPAWMSYYADYDKTVCQECFAEAKRCFLCRFPHSVESVKGLGHICEFCHDDVIGPEMDLVPFLQPIQAFLKKLRHNPPTDIKFQWVDWHLILGMQMKEPPQFKINFLDEFLHYSYPVIYLKGQFYLIKRMRRQLFLCHMAGQLAAADLCDQYGLQHLQGETPFHALARGWSHWVAYTIAGVLKYQTEQKQLSRWPEAREEEFQKFKAMSEFRKAKEIVVYGHRMLADYAKKYL